MGAGEGVFIGEIGTDAHGHGFFARVEVEESWDVSRREIFVKVLLELPDQAHPLVHPEEFFLADFHLADPPSLSPDFSPGIVTRSVSEE